MATLKSARFKTKQSRWARANTPEAVRRRIETMRRAKQERPAPNYACFAPGQEHVTLQISGPGWCYVLRATVPPEAGRRRPRSDQYVVTQDDLPLPDISSLTAMFTHARSLVPRRLSRDELATL